MEARHMKTLISLIVLLTLVTACASGPGKAELDAEVRRLCAIDGGVRVYETVMLPAERFDKYGQIHVPQKQSAKQSDEYYYEWKVTYLKSGNPGDGIPDLARSQFLLYRTGDNKLLGESVTYIRRGGNLPGPWHPSSFSCPSNANITDLKKQVFIGADWGKNHEPSR
jgi:hypothetical protein